MIKVLLHQEDKTIIHVYDLNTWALEYIKQILIYLKGEIGNNTIIAGDFSSSLPAI